MKAPINPNASTKWFWALAFVCAGLGCGLLGPLLPQLSQRWGLTDSQSGLLLGLLLAGSCCGTMTLGSRLERAVSRGACCAAAGILCLAFCMKSQHGFAPATASVAMLGFGLGSLMSAVNLLAGKLAPAQRTGMLAKLGAMWCVGAMLAPFFASARLGGTALQPCLWVLSLLFLACLSNRKAWSGGDVVTAMRRDKKSREEPACGPLIVLACSSTLFLYSGAEACISGWLTTFTSRYGGHTASVAPWVNSAFWFGLIISRMAVPRILSRQARETLIKVALPGAALVLVLLVLAPWTSLAAGPLLGFLIGPGFPLLLSGTLDWPLGARSKAVVLAAAALGGALCPLVLGQLSMLADLHTAMFFPAVILAVLPWLPRRTYDIHQARLGSGGLPEKKDRMLMYDGGICP